MNPELQQLMILSQQLISYIANNSDNLNAETQRALAEFLQQTMQFIEMQVQNTGNINQLPPQLPSSNETQDSPYPSSQINGFQYDPRSGKLLVKFQGKDVADAGPIYSYDDVPKHIYDVFRRGAVGPKTSGSNRWHTWKRGVTPSHGAAMNALIKAGGYKYQRLA